MNHRNLLLLVLFCSTSAFATDPSTQPFDGRPWNVSTGNLSVTYTQASPIGAFPRENQHEAPPSVESLAKLKAMGLVADEDYVSWGAVEREPGKWVWDQHDAMEKNLHAASLKYVAYNWVHFPPLWLREGRKNERTLMRCCEHDKECNYLSVFDPRTIEWYDHFYKNLHEHFGDRIDDTYACILGPYGEGNYPLYVPDWVNMGHCHEGYWAADEYAIKAFASAMEKKYADVTALNRAWGTQHASCSDVRPPKELFGQEFKPSPEKFKTTQDRRRWLDFITWYHQAIIDFAEKSIETVLKYYPPEKVRAKPGGTARGINPIAWGTYSPGYAKLAAKHRIVLQPADCQGAVFADKWLATAYKFYGVKLGTEPAGGLDQKSFTRRMFSDADCGAVQHFTYEFEAHADDIRKYVHLYTGEAGQTEIALYCPTTLYRLGGNLQPTIDFAEPLRDICNFDVLDELLISDGALDPRGRYKALIIVQGDVVEPEIRNRIDAWAKRGGKALAMKHMSLESLAPQLADCKGYDGPADGLWVCRRQNQMFMYNSTDKPVKRDVMVGDKKLTANVEPRAIWISP